MQGLQIHHPPPPPSTPLAAAVAPQQMPSLTIEEELPAERRIGRLIEENPVIVFSRRACCMCHVMRRLLATVGVHPTVIELDEEEMEEAAPPLLALASSALPALFIGGRLVGGLESVMGLHIGGGLVARLREVGALWG